MSASTKVAATRSNLMRLRRRLEQVDKGAALLRRKRESLVRELFALAKPAVDSRRAIEDQSLTAYRALLEALAAAASTDLRPLGWPTREVRLELVPRDVWGIHGVELGAEPRLVRSLAARGDAIGPGDAASTQAAEQFERLVEQLLAAAPAELFMRRLGDALSHVTRLVNTLERRVTTTLTRDFASVQRTLEEREREEHLRLKHISRAIAETAKR